MISTQPMSSPSRTEKFPPPLMRFLRSNVGGRSRGKSRASPMFIRKKNTATVTETTQEPSSPKVTCIGQVRVHRPTSAKRAKKPRPISPCRPRLCSWVKPTLFCPDFVKRIKPKSFCSVLGKWVGFFRSGCCRKVEIFDESVKLENEDNRGNKIVDANEDEIEEEEEEDGEGEVEMKLESSDGLDSCISLQPPKNALLLTRCRSAPYRSSSLASRFWGSETGSGDEAERAEQEQRAEDERETEDGDEAERSVQEQKVEDERETEDGNEAERPVQEEKVEEERESKGPTSEIEPNCRDLVSESIVDEESGANLGVLGEIVDSIDGKTEEIRDQEVETTASMVLTRCKSEPARTGEGLNPVARF
ncbi:hypothetical protein Vadar_010325 [Vaccinium darrowii]|nr:hypothetical protein Vadar_010325 [Vaccinium darrowii]